MTKVTAHFVGGPVNGRRKLLSELPSELTYYTLPEGAFTILPNMADSLVEPIMHIYKHRPVESERYLGYYRHEYHYAGKKSRS